MTARKWRYTADDLPKLSPFGSVLADRIVIAEYANSKWSQPRLIAIDEFQLHPGAHCLHYGSSCFEGLKAYRWANESLAIFRADQHAKRMVQSAVTLRLPVPEPDLFQQMLLDIVADAAELVPPAPGSLYLRPVLIGSDSNIGAAATPSKTALFYVLASPVGSYFAKRERALRLLIEDKTPRTTPQFGRVKTGANYAAALGMTLDAKEKWNIDQILFCPDGDVQETGASNFVLIDDKTIVTKPLSDSFLHGVTRDSVLTLAGEMGYDVQQRDFSVNELLEWTKNGEAALSGTAAVLAGVGTLIHNDKEYVLSNNETGPNTRRIRKALVDIQQGETAESHGWITHVK
jgi:branched-chain amino acid aminotransferase